MQNLTSLPLARTVTFKSSYKHLLNCLGTYNTLFEIRKGKHKFVCRGAEVKFHLIVLRMCICGVISYLYRNKLDIAGRGEVQGQTFQRVSLPLVMEQRSTILLSSTGRERVLFLPISDKIMYGL